MSQQLHDARLIREYYEATHDSRYFFGNHLPGDIVFFPSLKPKDRRSRIFIPGHVGIVVDETTFVHASDRSEVGSNLVTRRQFAQAARGYGRIFQTDDDQRLMQFGRVI